MAKAEVHAGICGFNTTIQTEMVDDVCRITLQSDCPAIERLGTELTQVDPLQEISSRRKVPQTLQMGLKYCTHAACPVPVGIIKAVEVEAGLALPADVTIIVTK
jgi:hypothetical protein